MWALLEALPALDMPTTGIGVLTLVAVFVGNRVFARVPGLRRVPAPLFAMLLAMAAQAYFAFPERRHHRHRIRRHSAHAAGTRTGRSLTLAQVLQLVGPAFAIALLGAIESLLTAVVADGMAGTRHDSNQELIGQGAANILAPLFGGFAATGAIARTATNIRNGATSPLAGVVHALFLVLVIVVLAPLASAIPLAALSAILFFVAWNMSDVRHFSRLLRSAPRADKLLLLITFGLTVFVDLVVAVNVGVVIAALLFMRRMAESVSVQEQVFGETDRAIDGNARATWRCRRTCSSIASRGRSSSARPRNSSARSSACSSTSARSSSGSIACPFMDATGHADADRDHATLPATRHPRAALRRPAAAVRESTGQTDPHADRCGELLRESARRGAADFVNGPFGPSYAKRVARWDA